MAEPLVIPDVKALRDWVGKKLGSSDWLEMTQERIDLFAEATGDKQWIHVDRERAQRESPFGTHDRARLPDALARAVPVRADRRGQGHAHDREPRRRAHALRAPVRCGDRVRLHATLKDLREIPGGAMRATIGLNFEIEGQSRPAAFGDAALVYYPELS